MAVKLRSAPSTTYCVGRNAAKRALGKGSQRVRARKRLQREMRAQGVEVRHHNSQAARASETLPNAGEVTA